MVSRTVLSSTLLLVLACLSTGVQARESLGVYNGWGAFRDPGVPRCYAIAMAEPSGSEREFQPYATVGTWPKSRVRSQVHFHLSRARRQGSQVTLSISGKRYLLTSGESDAWAANAADNAAIVAAMRSTERMSIYTRDRKGRTFSNTWLLPGAASAMDAAAVGCAKV